ncbi:unnamed protein product [Adineta ricciae]|uniref:Uncharacterized protein n=1 Tax=Adineta ricciae TaxID=249248 RepID=A0A813TQB0_ADIRI|nr:unnamed protein product [Adineta ricciae]CAF0820108.1 unnamed protein product [Adineta ricciae]
MNDKMWNCMQNFLQQIQTEVKTRDWKQQINASLVYARQSFEINQEQSIYTLATILILDLIFGWNVYLVGVLLVVYFSVSVFEYSVTINELDWLFYCAIYITFNVIEYSCLHYQFPFHVIYMINCICLPGFLFPDEIYDNIIIIQRSVREFVLNYNKQNQEFYNAKAGQSNIEDASTYDQYNNPIDGEYDLGRDGAFTDYRILIGQFYKSGDMKAPIDALEKKGFHVESVKTELEFIAKLRSEQYEIAWVISSSSIEQVAFIPTLIDFHAAGGAIFLFADNVPYVSHASGFLNKKFGISLIGNYPGNKTLVFNENGYLEPGYFGQHEIFTGIKNLFEGVTICHPIQSRITASQAMTTLATATDGQPCISVFEPPAGSSEGRLCLDCGFTKLFINWNSAGTARFVVNASCWLAKAMK